MKIEIGNAEEAIPTTIQEKIPLLGRVFKASDDAYIATAYQMRADLADMLVNNAIKNGLELTDEVLEGYGAIVNSMTGRGLKGIGRGGEITNVVLFSPKNIQSYWDFLTAHMFDKSVTGSKLKSFIPLTKATPQKVATQNLLRAIGLTAGIVYGVNTILDSFGVKNKRELDARSSDFGKAVINNTRFDLTGGMGSYITLFARLLWGYKDTDGIITKVGDYDHKTAMETFARFGENKFAPLTRAIDDYLNREDFNKNAVSFAEWKKDWKHMAWLTTKDYFLPITVENSIQPESVKQNNPFYTALLADGLGMNASIHTFDYHWEDKSTKEMVRLKKRFGEEKVKKAGERYGEEINKQMLKLIQTEKYKKLSNDDKKKAISRLKRSIKKRIMKEIR